MVHRVGDRVEMLFGKYAGQSGIFMGNRGEVSCAVRLDGSNRDVTIRLTSIKPLVKDNENTTAEDHQNLKDELRSLNLRMSDALWELAEVQDRIQFLSLK